MKKHKIFSLIITLVLTLGLLASCTGETLPKTDETSAIDTTNNEDPEVSVESIAVADSGSNEEIAQAWMDSWIDMYKALPDGDEAQLSDGVVDDLRIKFVSNDGDQRAFVFHVEVSIRPTKSIGTNGYWMVGNTGPSPGRASSWGQLYREIELKLSDDGLFHFVEMGTGGVGHSKGYSEP